MSTSSIAVTVIVPVRNEEHRIGRCMDSILRNDFPKEQLEILVADGMSTDQSRAIVTEYAMRCACIRLIDNPERLVSSGLNTAIRQARGQVLIIMGAHAEYPSNYIATCVSELERTQADAVGGILRTQPGSDTRIARAIALMSQHPFGVGWSSFRTRNAGRDVDTVPYGAYRREVFARVGLFNEQLVRNQDFEFNARVRRSGGRLFLSQNLETVYYNAPDFRSFAKKTFSNGMWLAKMWYSSPASVRVRHAVPSVFIVVLSLSILLALVGTISVGIPTLILAIYAVGASIASGQITGRAGKSLFFPLVGIFFTHHALYGVGTIAGVLYTLRPQSRRYNAGVTKATSD